LSREAKACGDIFPLFFLLFQDGLITEHLISTVPWDNVGNYVRFSATFAAKGESEEERIMSEIKKRLSAVEFEF